MKLIKVVQIIDSLSAGGAEMVAVNLANELSARPGFQSFLVVSRKTGLLEKRIKSGVQVLFLNKKRTFDLKAILKFYRFLKQEQIDIVHAHSSSFYYPVILKNLISFKLVWHDHYGKSIDLKSGKRDYPVKPFARFFDWVFAVNKNLVETDIRFFGIRENIISYLPNFSVSEKPKHSTDDFVLKGEQGDRIVCLANFRPQKDHLNLLKAFKMVLASRPDTYLYLIGGSNNDEYELEVVSFITKNALEQNVFWMGTLLYPASVLTRCGIGVLSSESEGLPLAIIEYGLAGLTVVSTAVGDIASMLYNGKDAILVAPKASLALAEALLAVLNKAENTFSLAANLQILVNATYSPEAVLLQVCHKYKKILAVR